MIVSRRELLGAAALASLPAGQSQAQQRQAAIKIGVLTDLSGPYRDITGQTSIVCVEQAVSDVHGSKDFEVQVISADHKNDPRRGVGIVRQWFDGEGVDAIADCPNSAVALAVSDVCREKDKVLLTGSATAIALTGQKCSPNTVVWSFDTYTAAKSTGGAAVKSGNETWYFITADYIFGHSLEEQTAKVVTDSGGKVLGQSRYPFPETYDFARYLQEAARSGAKVLGLANSGTDTLNCISQAYELGLPRLGNRIAPLQMFITDVHALGSPHADGLNVTETFYWNLNDRTRAFTNRVRPRTPNNIPNTFHASTYAIALHYLKAVGAMWPVEAKKSGAATVARMKQTPTDDDAFGQGSIRENGRGLFPAYLFEVKPPQQGEGPWDLYKPVTTTRAEEAVMPLDQTGCKIARA
ncbi:MAG: ABC transporter substrate-binding protein [Acetobacteraceae bacterium]|nr:ABC transporter substrate-binding protein [Acetobacteraceae bacterium]